MLSIQKIVRSHEVPVQALSSEACPSLLQTVAAVSSIRGMVGDFKGATLAFAIIRVDWASPIAVRSSR